MPTYEYKCGACGHAFEKFQSITAAPIKECPECGKRKVKRLIGTGAGIIFKGSGFYCTDYRSQGYKDSAKSDGGSKSDGASKGDSSSKSSDGSTPAKSESKSTTPAAAPAPAASKPAKEAAAPAK